MIPQRSTEVPSCVPKGRKVVLSVTKEIPMLDKLLRVRVTTLLATRSVLTDQLYTKRRLS